MLALIGAYRLAGELCAADGNHRVAFRRYEDFHRPLVGRSQSNLFIGIVAPKTRAGIWARNTMARLPMVAATAGLERRLQPKTQPLSDYPHRSANTTNGPHGDPTALDTKYEAR
jgi:hypothetical protein